MSTAPDWLAIAADTARAAGHPFHAGTATAVGGGSVNRAFRIEDRDHRYFVKINEAGRRSMFDAEREGLSALRAANAVRVPQAVCTGADARYAWIVMEFLDIDAGRGIAPALGRSLAALHRCGAGRFGWHRDNTIGSTPQSNDWSTDWIAFLRERRLGYQLALARRSGFGGRLQSAGARLLERLDTFFTGYRPQPSLLHGDLWAGNAAVLTGGEPVIFDPAVYFGDREADLAMTELFGGFPAGFYDEYRDAWPLDPGYRVRRKLYNLYQLLNHLNLSGAGYLGQTLDTLDELLSHAKA